MPVSLSARQPARPRRVEDSRRLPFSLSAFLLAPWPVPLAGSALLGLTSPGSQLGAFFFLSLAFGLVVSYLGTAALVVTLHFVAQARPVTRVASACTGLVLAGLGYLPFVFVTWSSGGPDSGPPVESFTVYLLRSWNDPILGFFLAGGLVTAVLYDTLARRRASKKVVSVEKSVP
jgi:hypothetical protein